MKNRMQKYAAVLLLAVLSTGGAYWLSATAAPISGRIAEAANKKEAMDKVPLKKKAILLEAGLKQENELQTCYESLLSRNPKIEEGTVEVHWMLDGHGKISSMELAHTDLDDETFVSCLLEKVKTMTFKAPPQARPTLVAHKFNFHKRAPASVTFKQAGGSQNSSEE